MSAFVFLCLALIFQKNMYNIIQHSHSGIMWLVVGMLTVSVVASMLKFINKCDKPKDYLDRVI